jgi:hypothetical protein
VRFAALFRDYQRRAPYAVASVAARGTHASVYGYAAEIEQQGRVPGCVRYDDRQWLALAGVTASEVADAIKAGLLVVDGDDLIVDGYDLGGEAKVAAARENGRKPTRPGKRRGRPKKTDEKPDGRAREIPTVSPGKTETKPKENPLSGSGAGVVSEIGGGGPPPPSLGEERREPEPDLEAAVAAFRSARDRAAERKPEIDRSESDLAELSAALRALPAADLAHVPRASVLYFKREGKTPTDRPHWRERQWDMHTFATQGLGACLPHARLGVKVQENGFPDDWDLSDARERLRLKAAGASL